MGGVGCRWDIEKRVGYIIAGQNWDTPTPSAGSQASLSLGAELALKSQILLNLDLGNHSGNPLAERQRGAPSRLLGLQFNIKGTSEIQCFLYKVNLTN